MKNQNFLTILLLIFSFAANAQTPKYDSYPSASAVIFLDFDGQKVEGTMWNTSGAIFCAPSGLNSTQITEVFNRISEDYRPFNINVTTDSTKYWNAPANKRMRVIFTTTSEWYGSAGGVAYVNSFRSGDNTPCFVFTALLNYNVKNISESAAHEAGHTLGLRHQSLFDGNCAKTTEYNAGAGNGEIGWAPIMGVGYYRNFTVWHNGTSTYGCNAYQNDLEIITSTNNGFGYRTDDHNDMPQTATNATFSNNQFIVSGVISKTDDIDYFKFNITSPSRFQLNGIPYNVGTGNTGSDLDMQVELINDAKQVIGVYNPGHELSSIVDTILSVGTYYIKVDGKGNAYASEYGSLGSFSLQGQVSVVTPLALHKLELKGEVDGAKHNLSWIIEADEKVVYQKVEVSENGASFNEIAQPVTAAKNYSYTPASNSTMRYRLNVVFENGYQYYSNTIILKNGNSISKPQLAGNAITGSSLVVKSPSTYSYTITDFNGKQVGKGQVLQGTSTINTGYITSGMYIIRFSNEQEQYVEKFMKQ